MIKEITSSQNSTYKYIKALKSKKTRTEYGQYTVEGIKSVRDAIDAGADIEFIAVSDKLSDNIDFKEKYLIKSELFSGLSDTETPQGVIAVINMQGKEERSFSDDMYIYCDRVTDPGNMGTIIRICDAVDCGLLLSPGCVDIFSPKTVRATMGSFFHTRILTDIELSDLIKLKENGYFIASGTLGKNTLDYRECKYKKKNIIAVGNEANGISAEVVGISDCLVKIPIWGRAESLNVAVAAGIMAYEVKRKSV